MKNLDILIEKYSSYLCPPGNGVFTVHTAQENKSKLHNKLYNTDEPEAVRKQWLASLEELTKNTSPLLLGITMDTGGGIQRGANWGPLFIRDTLLQQSSLAKYLDLGDIRTIPHLLHDKYLNKETINECRNALYGSEQIDLPVSGLSIAEDFCDELHKVLPNNKVLSLGGDHSVSYPIVKSWIAAKRAKGIKVAIIHFDAHTDLMAKRLGIDICFGTWAYHMIELLEKPSHLLQFGIRSSGKPKEYWQDNLGVQQYWNYDFKDQGVDLISKQVTEYLKENQIEEVYVSFDIDALDAKYASSTGTPETGGLAPHECVQLIESVAAQCKITGADVVEVAPFVISSQKDPMSPEPETTLQSAAIIANKLLEVM